ncbi:hypothetical protein FO519_006020 [Halicephalobus sp. NKZ332]|nr:hypothetical protein FO519_006020 [Halicephalobus sp. NKZ332]
MPKNKGKGGKNRRRGKNENDGVKRELQRKDGDEQAYAQVTKMLGNGRLLAFCFDGRQRMCHIRGKLLGLRGYQDDKADVILKYSPEEARLLKNEGSLPESATLNEGGEDHDAGDVEFLDFGDEEDEEGGVADQDRHYELSSSSEESSEEEEDDDDEETLAAGKKGIKNR